MTALSLLRGNPETATKAYGFVTRGNPLGLMIGGGCTLTCNRIPNTGVYQLDVASGGSDWFIPYRPGKALYCDVPKGQNPGTLIVTAAMNGCALDVCRTQTGMRLYHDADGNCMPGGKRDGITRIEYANMCGEAEQTKTLSDTRHTDPKRGMAATWEHTVICIKRSDHWAVYQTCIITTMKAGPSGVARDCFQVKDRVPYQIGVFADG